MTTGTRTNQMNYHGHHEAGVKSTMPQSQGTFTQPFVVETIASLAKEIRYFNGTCSW
jgi:hypothetical protein